MDQIIIGVDTHKSNHVGVAISRQGARLGTITIPTTRQGYRDLEAWASKLGVPSRTFALTNVVCHCSSRGQRCAS